MELVFSQKELALLNFGKNHSKNSEVFYQKAVYEEKEYKVKSILRMLK